MVIKEVLLVAALAALGISGFVMVGYMEILLIVKLWCYESDKSIIAELIENKKVGSASRNLHLWFFDVTEEELEDSIYWRLKEK